VSKPVETLIGFPSETTFAKVYIRNETNWPYKAGCVLASKYDQSVTPFLEEVKLHMQQVPANTEY